MNKVLFAVVMFVALVVGQVSAETELLRADFCMDGSYDGEIISEDVVFSGDPLNINLPSSIWVVPFNTITIQFTGGEELVWNPESVGPERIMALGDWIESATSIERDSGFRVFAVQQPDGSVWLVNQFRYETEFRCFAHLLD